MPTQQTRSDAALTDITVTTARNVSTEDGRFLVPTDTDKSAWDLDPNADGDFVIPDDISGRTSTQKPDVGNAEWITFIIESQDSENLSFKIEHFDAADSTTVRATEDKNDSDLFGPDTFIRHTFGTGWPFVKVTVTSEVSAGTQNQFTMAMETH